MGLVKDFNLFDDACNKLIQYQACQINHTKRNWIYNNADKEFQIAIWYENRAYHVELSTHDLFNDSHVYAHSSSMKGNVNRYIKKVGEKYGKK